MFHRKATGLNMGEAASTDAIGPEHVYCPSGQNRTEKIGTPNSKVYITSVGYSYLFTPALVQEAIHVELSTIT